MRAPPDEKSTVVVPIRPPVTDSSRPSLQAVCVTTGPGSASVQGTMTKKMRTGPLRLNEQAAIGAGVLMPLMLMGSGTSVMPSGSSGAAGTMRTPSSPRTTSEWRSPSIATSRGGK